MRFYFILFLENGGIINLRFNKSWILIFLALLKIKPETFLMTMLNSHHLPLNYSLGCKKKNSVFQYSLTKFMSIF